MSSGVSSLTRAVVKIKKLERILMSYSDERGNLKTSWKSFHFILKGSRVIFLISFIFVCICRTLVWDRNNLSPQGLQDVAAALEK